MSFDVEQWEKAIDWHETVREYTELARHEDFFADLRAYLETQGFNPQRLLFAELIGGEDDILYTMFVTPKGQIYEVEENLYTKEFFNFKAYDSVDDAAKRIPLVLDALDMLKHNMPA